MSLNKSFLTCIVCKQVFDRSEWDVGTTICSIGCKYWHGIPDKTDPGCWIWRFKKHRIGFGVVRWKGLELMAHRIGFAQRYGYEKTPTIKIFNLCGHLDCARGDHWTTDTSQKWKNTLARRAKGLRPANEKKNPATKAAGHRKQNIV